MGMFDKMGRWIVGHYHILREATEPKAEAPKAGDMIVDAYFRAKVKNLIGKNDFEKIIEIGKPAVPGLVEALEDGRWPVKAAAAGALGDIGDVSGVPALVKALGDEDFYVRIQATGALGKIGDVSGVPALTDAITDRDGRVREAAVDALRRIGDVSGVPALVKALGDGNDFVEVRPKAIKSLEAILTECDSPEKLNEFEIKLGEGFHELSKMNVDTLLMIEAETVILRLSKKTAAKKNELVSKRDLMLVERPKPPKKGGGMWQAARRVRHV